MIKIAGTKSNDKINFKEFVDFFYKVDWVRVLNLQSLNGGIGMHTVERAWDYSLCSLGGKRRVMEREAQARPFMREEVCA